MRDIARQENIHNSGMITTWINRYRAAGSDALKPYKKGRKKTLDKPKKNTVAHPVEQTIVDTSVEHVKELEDELLKLRIENAFLKERRKLRFEDEAKTRERRNQEYVVNKKRVQRIMKKLGVQVTSFTHKSRKYNSYKGKVGTVAPNRIRRCFNTHILHQKITTDTTEFKYYEVDAKSHMTLHKLYLDPYMDMCNSEILSFGIDKHPSAKNVRDALTSDRDYFRLSLS